MHLRFVLLPPGGASAADLSVPFCFHCSGQLRARVMQRKLELLLSFCFAEAEQPNGSPVVSPCSYCVAKQGTKQKGTYKGSSRTPFKPTKGERKTPGDRAYV